MLASRRTQIPSSIHCTMRCRPTKRPIVIETWRRTVSIHIFGCWNFMILWRSHSLVSLKGGKRRRLKIKMFKSDNSRPHKTIHNRTRSHFGKHEISTLSYDTRSPLVAMIITRRSSSCSALARLPLFPFPFTTINDYCHPQKAHPNVKARLRNIERPFSDYPQTRPAYTQMCDIFRRMFLSSLWAPHCVCALEEVWHFQQVVESAWQTEWEKDSREKIEPTMSCEAKRARES